ncbi:hypothetical protein ScPMuIL_011309 [Solemya velum]
MDLMWRLSKVRSTEEFLQNFVKKDGQPINISSIETTAEHGDKVVVSGGEEEDLVLAGPDRCQPRLRTVVIPRDPDPSVMYWPTCTRIERCGGCCPTEILECLPVKMEMVAVNVLKTRESWPASDLDYQGPFPVLIQRDLDCEPRCRIQPHHCNPLQHYNEWTCSCDCNDDQSNKCGDRKIWDKDMCSCVCPVVKKCRGVFEFSESTCRCEDRSTVSGDMKLSEVIEFLKNRNKGDLDTVLKEFRLEADETLMLTLKSELQNLEVSEEASQEQGSTVPPIETTHESTEESTTEVSTVAETVPTTVASTEPSTTADTRTVEEKCSHAPPCPPRFKQIIHTNGKCACKPMFTRPRPRSYNRRGN